MPEEQRRIVSFSRTTVGLGGSLTLRSMNTVAVALYSCRAE